MALRSEDLPALPKPAKATFGLTANFFLTCSTISSTPSIAIGPLIMRFSGSGAAVGRPSGEETERDAGSRERAGCVGGGVAQVRRTTGNEKLVELVREAVERCKHYGHRNGGGGSNAQGPAGREQAEAAEDRVARAMQELVVGK